MSDKNLVIIINASQGYIRNIEDPENFASQNDILFSAISETYLPLLNMMARLCSEDVKFKISLVISAPLCALLDDPVIQKQYIDWLDKRIAFGEKEIKRCAKNDGMKALAEEMLLNAKRDKVDFTEVYAQKLIPAFRMFAEKGVLELIPTSATNAYLPHYADLTEIINAQVETGLYSHRNFFGDIGEGFWLPYQGFAKGLDRVLRSYGVNYTVVDPRSMLFVDNPVDTGIFAPVRCGNSLVLFGSDPDTPKDISGEEGFMHNPVYRSQQRDIGFELSQEELKDMRNKDGLRVQTLYKYWANGDEQDDEDAPLYDKNAALSQIQADAADFYCKKLAKLDEAESLMEGKPASLVCCISAELLGQNWYEGITWLENVIRLADSQKTLNLETCKNLIQDQFSLPKITPYPCSANGTGYGEDLLDSSNSWMLRYLRTASERMIDLAERFPSETGLKARLLNTGARELLIAQSGEWPQMLHDGKLPDYVEETFTKAILNFSRVFDALASNTVSTEWLTNLEREHAVFPWINYRIFSRKK